MYFCVPRWFDRGDIAFLKIAICNLLTVPKIFVYAETNFTAATDSMRSRRPRQSRLQSSAGGGGARPRMEGGPGGVGGPQGGPKAAALPALPIATPVTFYFYLLVYLNVTIKHYIQIHMILVSKVQLIFVL